MLREMFVFELQRRVDEFRRDIAQRGPNSEFLIGAQRDPQHVSVAIAHNL